MVYSGLAWVIGPSVGVLLFSRGHTPEPYGIVFWILGAVGGAVLDIVGNIPFMRMVKPRRRNAMTAVFSTWREVSALITPAIAAAALAIGSFPLLLPRDRRDARRRSRGSQLSAATTVTKSCWEGRDHLRDVGPTHSELSAADGPCGDVVTETDV